MGRIRTFKCDWEVKLYIQSRVFREVNSGSEGTCYEGRDKKIYKYLDFDTSAPYIIEEIITEEDIQLESFAFPEELYVVDDTLRGYRTKKVARDYFGDNIFDIENITEIDFAAVAKAYRRMLEDVRLLSEEKILIFDLPFNLMFDGENLVGIDTCGYKRVNYDPLNRNIKSLNHAIEGLFKLWITSPEELDKNPDKINALGDIKGTNIDEFLSRVMKMIPPDISIDRFFQVIGNDVNKAKGKR